jgi:hypothetical protein
MRRKFSMTNLAIEDGPNPGKNNIGGTRGGNTCRINCVMLHLCWPTFEFISVPLLRPNSFFDRHL